MDPADSSFEDEIFKIKQENNWTENPKPEQLYQW